MSRIHIVALVSKLVTKLVGEIRQQLEDMRSFHGFALHALNTQQNLASFNDILALGLLGRPFKDYLKVKVLSLLPDVLRLTN